MKIPKSHTVSAACQPFCACSFSMTQRGFFICAPPSFPPWTTRRRAKRPAEPSRASQDHCKAPAPEGHKDQWAPHSAGICVVFTSRRYGYHRRGGLRTANSILQRFPPFWVQVMDTPDLRKKPPRQASENWTSDPHMCTGTVSTEKQRNQTSAAAGRSIAAETMRCPLAKDTIGKQQQAAHPSKRPGRTIQAESIPKCMGAACQIIWAMISPRTFGLTYLGASLHPE